MRDGCVLEAMGFLNHLCGDEQAGPTSAPIQTFLNHLYGDERKIVLGALILKLLNHLYGERNRDAV